MTIPTDSRPHIYPDAKMAPKPFLLICPDSVNYLTPNLACFCPDKNRPTGSKSSNFVRTGERPVRAYSRVLVQYPERNKTCTVNVRAQGFGLMRARPDHAEMCLPSTCRSSLSTLFVDCQLRDPTDFEFGIDLISFCRQHSTPL